MKQLFLMVEHPIRAVHLRRPVHLRGAVHVYHYFYRLRKHQESSSIISRTFINLNIFSDTIKRIGLWSLGGSGRPTTGRVAAAKSQNFS